MILEIMIQNIWKCHHSVTHTCRSTHQHKRRNTHLHTHIQKHKPTPTHPPTHTHTCTHKGHDSLTCLHLHQVWQGDDGLKMDVIARDNLPVLPLLTPTPLSKQLLSGSCPVERLPGVCQQQTWLCLCVNTDRIHPQAHRHKVWQKRCLQNNVTVHVPLPSHYRACHLALSMCQHRQNMRTSTQT